MKGTILIVEDQPNFREGLRLFIEQESIGWKVIGEAETGEDGWKKILDLRPDLVLMDIHMPVMNGIQLAESIHAHRIDTLFVMITGFQDFQYAQSAIRFGALDFLLKPCSDEDISRILRAAFDKLEEKRSNQLSLRTTRENILRSILLKLQLSEQMASQLLKAFGNRQLWLISVDDYFPPGKNYREEDVYLIQYGIINIIQELIQDEAIPSELLVLTVDQFILSTFSDMDLEAWKQKIAGAVRAYLGIQLDCFSLGSCTDIPALLAAYAVCNQRLQRVSVPLAMQDFSNRNIVKNGRREIMSLIVSGDTGSLPAYFDDCFLLMADKHLSEAKMIAINQVIALNEVSELLFPASAQTYSVTTLLEHMQKLQDSEQLEHWLRSLCTDFLGRLAQWKNSSNQNSTLFEKALLFIKEHYLGDCSISQVAEHVHLNPSYFSTLFKKEKGETFTSYVNKLKLERAQVLLRNTDMRMIEICQAVGFDDSTYFSSIFKKYFHVSPSEFRQNQKLEE